MRKKYVYGFCDDELNVIIFESTSMKDAERKKQIFLIAPDSWIFLREEGV